MCVLMGFGKKKGFYQGNFKNHNYRKIATLPSRWASTKLSKRDISCLQIQNNKAWSKLKYVYEGHAIVNSCVWKLPVKPTFHGTDHLLNNSLQKVMVFIMKLWLVYSSDEHFVAYPAMLKIIFWF